MNKKLEYAEFELFDASNQLGYLNSTLDNIMVFTEEKGLNFIKAAKQYIQHADQSIFNGRKFIRQVKDEETK